MLALQHCKLTREQNENVEEWMGYLRFKANECSYKEKDRRLKEQFINGVSDKEMMAEITSEFSTIKETNKVTCEQAFCWAKWTEV